ncbi:MAG: MFS transporter [Planctomycetota bacterium]
MDPAENNFRYVGWRVVLVASLAMVATLPGRTVGLGLITEPLLEDLQLSRVRYSNLTIWATIIGALLSPVCGRAIDRWGVKTCLPAVIMLLGLTTISMSHYVTAANVIVFLILSRGFGQSSLSTASVTAVGKFFESHLGIALGVFSALVAVGFVLTIPTVDGLIGESNWRSCWFGIGGFLIALAAFTFLTIPAKGQKQSQSNHNEVSVTWSSAMKTRFFWSFTVSVGLKCLASDGNGIS